MLHQDSHRPAQATHAGAVSRALIVALSALFTAFSSHASAGERTIQLTPFSALQLDLPAHYVIREAGAASARVRGDSELIDRIVVEQHDDRVRVYVPGSISFQGQLVIEVDTVGLKDLAVNGSGQVEASGFKGSEFSLHLFGASPVKIAELDVDMLRVEMQGSGRVEASGRASTQRMRIAGSAVWRGANLAADKVDVKVEGASKVEVMARERLTARVSGASSVRYRGDPELSTSITGVATVAKM